MFLGIEIGGTKLQLGIGAGDGHLVALWRGPVDVAAGGEGIRQQISAAVPELLQQAGMNRAQLQGVGIGFGGPVDDATRSVIKSHQIEGWDNFPLADWISEMVDLPAALGNDADCAGLAEALFGAGKGLSPTFYITIGSGIGGGLIINGAIYRGCGRGAAEIGHLRIVREDPDPTNEGTSPLLQEMILEHFASGWAIAQAANQRIHREKYKASLLAQMAQQKGQLTTEDVAAAARQQDHLAMKILMEAWQALALGIRHVIALLSPRRIVIGGGVSLMGEDLLFGPLRSLVARSAFQPFAHCYDIVPAALGEAVVVQGALALARQRLSG
jgi:glucokinase